MSGQDADRAGDAWAAPGWRESALEYHKHRSRPDKKAADSAIAQCASLSPVEYDRQRHEEAKKLGIKLATLDREVAKLRAKQETADDPLPHWNVEPCPDPVDGAALLDAIRQVFRRYIVLPRDADIALALWVLHAWTMDAGEISPFMVLVSPTKRCGKTSVLVLLQYLTPRSELASNITPSALFRYIKGVRPTLLIDEADSFVKDNEELRGILNSGHTKAAAYVIRTVEVAGDHKPRRFSTWAPKAIATIRKLADTLEDRAVIVSLQRKPPGAQVERLRRRDNDEFAKLRSQAARWAADNFGHLADPDPQMPEELNDRAADNWRPLLAIADLAGPRWSGLARAAVLQLSGESQDDALGVELLRDIRKAFGDAKVIRSKDLVEKLGADPERPWAEYNHGRPITQRQVARLLDAFHIISCTVHPDGLPHGKGYRRVDFEEAWAAYCADQNVSAAHPTISIRASVQVPTKSAQISDFASVRKGEAHGSRNGNLSYSHAELHACTDKTSDIDAREVLTKPDLAADDLDIPEFLRRSPIKPPPPINSCANPSAHPVLDERDIEVLARSYVERVNASRKGGCEGDQTEADEWLRWRLSDLVPPELVDLEFEHVMQIVFRPKQERK
jgi:putative DNA primase/helicase